jgi:hypothetical protein
MKDKLMDTEKHGSSGDDWQNKSSPQGLPIHFVHLLQNPCLSALRGFHVRMWAEESAEKFRRDPGFGGFDHSGNQFAAHHPLDIGRGRWQPGGRRGTAPNFSLFRRLRLLYARIGPRFVLPATDAPHQSKHSHEIPD